MAALGFCTAFVLCAAGCRKSEPALPPPPPSDANTVGVSTAHFEQADGGKGAVAEPIKAAAPAPKPTVRLPAGAACVTPACHAGLAAARHIHGPVAKNACDTCHADDVGGHKYPMLRDKTKMCTFCHAVSGTAPHQHKALEQGCTICHDPHVSNVKYLIKGDSIDRMCASCHRVPWKRFTHTILTRGPCTICHQPHQSDNEMLLLGGQGPGNCYLCHDGLRRQMASLPHVHKPAARQCVTCHSPHASDFANQLKAPILQTCLNNACHDHDKVAKRLDAVSRPHEAILIGRQCANCHEAHATAEPLLMSDRMDRVCLHCHDKPVKARDGHTIPDMRPVLVESKYPHGPVRDGQCSACHDAHGSDLPGMLTAPYPRTFYARFDINNMVLCFTCHIKQMALTPKTTALTGFRNGDINLHYLHVNREPKGRTCRTCHAVHGSDLPKHMASDVPFEGSNWSMPIKFEKTNTGGSCSPGCHEPLGYDREHPRPRPAKRPTGEPTTKGA